MPLLCRLMGWFVSLRTDKVHCQGQLHNDPFYKVCGIHFTMVVPHCTSPLLSLILGRNPLISPACNVISLFVEFTLVRTHMTLCFASIYELMIYQYKI
jgi:hypothetical protein